MLSRAFLTLLILGCFQANAVRFRNAYVSFELPPNWNCKLEGSEWVCDNQFSQKTKEAIIILTAKEVGPTDTLQAYMAHLQTPRQIQGKNGPTKSQIIHTQERNIGGQTWVDGMHLGSEVGPYFTRYLATIKDKIAVLVTFSAHKEHYTKYSGDFIKAVESLRIVATKDTLGDRSGSAGGKPGGDIGIIGTAGGGPMMSDDPIPPPEASGGAKGKYFNYLIGAIVLLALGGYFFVRSGKKTKKKK